MIRNVNELYHSSVYLGQDYSDGIKHWKYIDKEIIKGKWVYYYKDDKLNKYKQEKHQAEKDLLSTTAKLTKKDSKFVSTYRANQKKNLYVGEDAIKVRKLEEKVDKAYKKYNNRYIATTPQRVLAKGIAAVANFFQRFKK